MLSNASMNEHRLANLREAFPSLGKSQLVWILDFIVESASRYAAHRAKDFSAKNTLARRKSDIEYILLMSRIEEAAKELSERAKSNGIPDAKAY
jgi:hypothetical protein